MEVPRGFLNKLGEKGIKTWKKRFFEFKDYQLYYYTGDNLSTCLGYINLNTAMSVENADKVTPSKDQFGFVIILPDRKWHLAATSDSERDHWVRTIKNLITSTNNAASIGSNASPMNGSPLTTSEEIPRMKPRRSISQGNLAAVPSFHPIVASKPQSTVASRRNSIDTNEVPYSTSPANGRPIPPLPPRKGGQSELPPPLPGTPPGAAKKKRPMPPPPVPKGPKGPGVTVNGPNPNAISSVPPVPSRPGENSGGHMGSPPSVPSTSPRPTLQRNVPSTNMMTSSFKTPLGEFSANSQQGLGPKNQTIPIVMNPSPRTTVQLGPSDVKEIAADPQKRANAAKEILSTEQYYVDCLKIMIDRYMKPLQQSLNSKDRTITYTEADIKTLFSNLEVVIPLNVELLKELTTIVGNWSEQQKIGATFLRMAPFLKMYYEYSIAYNTALDTYNRLVRDQNFAQRLLNYRTESGINLSLEHLLIMPVQRMPRYVMLLTELSRATPFTHPDKDDIEKAIAKLQEVTQHVNDFIKKAESSKKMGGLEVFIQPHRSLIWDGMLEPKLDSIKGKRDGRRFILFNDLLVHLPQSRAKSTEAMQVHEYLWPMYLVWLNPIKDGVELIGPSKTYVFTHKDQSLEEKQFIAGVTDAVKKILGADNPPIERSGFYQFDEERTYEGDWVLGKMHGKGTQVFLHSSQYKGDFKENMKYGKGVMVWDGGEMYNGDWQDDKPHGQGEMNYPSGDKYDGGWVDGMKFGQGTFLFINGDVFRGIWAKDVPNGAGFFSAHNGYVYEGNWKDGLYYGEGTLIGPAFKYTGSWLDGLRHGQGKLTNGTTEYEGNWKADKRHGKGRWKTTVNGLEMVYEGEWDYDQKNGKGTMTYWDKSVYVGMWKDEKRAGTGTFTFSSDAAGRKVYEGDWANDKMNGRGSLTFTSGELWEGHFKDNQPHGSMLITNSQTNTKVDAKFEHGKREGRAVIGPATKTNDKWKFEGNIKGNVLDRPGKTDVLVAPPAPHFNLPQIY